MNNTREYLEFMEVAVHEDRLFWDRKYRLDLYLKVVLNRPTRTRMEVMMDYNPDWIKLEPFEIKTHDLIDAIFYAFGVPKYFLKDSDVGVVRGLVDIIKGWFSK